MLADDQQHQRDVEELSLARLSASKITSCSSPLQRREPA
jgi:hypothetical protein